MGYDGQLMMVKVEFEKGAVGTLHEHYHSQATYVADGFPERGAPISTLSQTEKLHYAFSYSLSYLNN